MSTFDFDVIGDNPPAPRRRQSDHPPVESPPLSGSEPSTGSPAVRGNAKAARDTADG